MKDDEKILRLLEDTSIDYMGVMGETAARLVIEALDRGGYKIVRKDMTEQMLERLKGSAAAQSQVS